MNFIINYCNNSSDLVKVLFFSSNSSLSISPEAYRLLSIPSLFNNYTSIVVRMTGQNSMSFIWIGHIGGKNSFNRGMFLRIRDVVISCQSSNLNQFKSFYIYHINEKGKPWKKALPSVKNDITIIFDP